MTSTAAPVDPRATGAPRIDADNPWPGLDSFREENSAFFFGRDAEVAELSRRVLRQGLTVVFGRSGLGKTSLLRAGLFPGLRERNVFPVYVRLDFNAGSPPPADQILAKILGEARERGIELPATRAGDSLWELFHRRNAVFWSERNRPVTPLIVLDQFEEVFTLGEDPALTEQTRSFLEELADLVEGRPPRELRERLERSPADAREYAFREHPYKVLLSLREEWLPDLEAMRERMPSVVHNRLRLFPMNGRAALTVVAQQEHLVTDEVARKVVQFVAGSDAPLEELQVEPALISLMCSELNLERRRRDDERITEDLLEGTASSILENFYESSVRGAAPEVRAFIEDQLLTVNGYRDSVAFENALATPGVSAEAIDALVECRLLRRDSRDGKVRIELMHDRLLDVIVESRDMRHAREERAAAAAARLEAEEKERESRRRLRAARNTFISVAVLAVVTLGLGIFAWWSWKNLEDARQTIASERETAQNALDRAAEEAQNALDDAAEKAKEERDQLAEEAQNALDEAAEEAKEERDRLAEEAQNALDEAAQEAKEERDRLAKEAQVALDEAAASARAALLDERSAAEEQAKANLLIARTDVAELKDPDTVEAFIKWTQLWPRGESLDEVLGMHETWVREAERVLEHLEPDGLLSERRDELITLSEHGPDEDRRLVESRLKSVDLLFAQREVISTRLALLADRRAIIEAKFPLWKQCGIAPQDGLVPLGPNEQGNWEFWHTTSGDEPTSDRAPGEGLTLVLVPSGRFEMGNDSSARPAEGPSHEVTVSAPFWISKYEMTHAQWARLTTGEVYADADGALPIGNVTFDECSKSLPAWSLEFPTEAEWEYACRAGTTTEYWSGDGVMALTDVGWTLESSGNRLHKVGEKKANAFGLHDMHGNVWEYCADGYHEYSEGTSDAQIPAQWSVRRIARGGSFDYAADYARSAYRSDSFPLERKNVNTGVRPKMRIQMAVEEAATTLDE